MEPNTDWREFVESLNSTGVEFLLVGALAGTHPGLPRNTADTAYFERLSSFPDVLELDSCQAR